MHDVRGQRIVSCHVGPWDKYPGVELPGVAGSTWHYADAFVSLETGSVLRLTPREITVVARRHVAATKVILEDDAGKGCVGCRVEDILEVDSETHLVLLNDRRYLANRCVPGGTSCHIGRFGDWEPDELAGGAKDLRHVQRRP